MHNGVITFDRPQACIHRPVREMEVKPFGAVYGNFETVDKTGGDIFDLDENGM